MTIWFIVTAVRFLSDRNKELIKKCQSHTKAEDIEPFVKLIESSMKEIVAAYELLREETSKQDGMPDKEKLTKHKGDVERLIAAAKISKGRIEKMFFTLPKAKAKAKATPSQPDAAAEQPDVAAEQPEV